MQPISINVVYLKKNGI